MLQVNLLRWLNVIEISNWGYCFHGGAGRLYPGSARLRTSAHV